MAIKGGMDAGGGGSQELPRQHGRVLCKQMDGLKRGLLAAGWGKD